MRRDGNSPGSVHFYLQNLEPGGAQPAMIRLANEFSRRGIETHLIANTTSGFWRSAVGPDVRLHDLRAANSFAAVLKLMLFLKTARPRVVLSAMTHANLVAVLASRLGFSGARVVISERHACSRWLAGLRRSRKLVFGLLVPMVYPRADAIVAVASAAADDLSSVIRIARERIDVIYNAGPKPSAIEEAGRPAHPWFDASGPPVIVAAGRLEPQKDFTTLLRAFAILRRSRPLRLMILGEGRERSGLAALAEKLGISEDVCLAGQCDSALPFMKHASLFVLSSRFEGFPNVLVEALACGAPVVATDCASGPREILKDGAIGPLVPVGDAELLADAMASTLDDGGDPGLRKTRAADFTLERTADAYLQLLGRVTASSGGRS